MNYFSYYSYPSSKENFQRFSMDILGRKLRILLIYNEMDLIIRYSKMSPYVLYVFAFLYVNKEDCITIRVHISTEGRG